MCKPIDEEKRVLAAETFLHTYQGSRNISHSVIRFKTPVNVSEIKILSPSMYLNNESGALILGATEPCEFKVQFFCNNYYNHNRFENLGVMDYCENVRTILSCPNNIYADRVVICGRFLAITVVVSGSPEDPTVSSVQRRDRRCNIPGPLAFGANEILYLPENFYMDPSIRDILRELHSEEDSSSNQGDSSSLSGEEEGGEGEEGEGEEGEGEEGEGEEGEGEEGEEEEEGEDEEGEEEEYSQDDSQYDSDDYSDVEEGDEGEGEGEKREEGGEKEGEEEGERVEVREEGEGKVERVEVREEEADS